MDAKILQFVKAAKQQMDDEQFVVNVHKYISLYRKFLPISKSSIALVLDNTAIKPTKYGYQAKIINIYDLDKDELVFNDEYIEFFDDNKTIYNQIYLSEGIVNQINRSHPQAALFIGLDTQTIKKGKEIYQSHPIKVVDNCALGDEWFQKQFDFFPSEMGRARIYATEAEAKEAKKAQMKAAYERRKAAKASVKEEPIKEAPNTIQEAVAQIVNDTPPKARKLKIAEKAQLWDTIQKMVSSATQ